MLFDASIEEVHLQFYQYRKLLLHLLDQYLIRQVERLRLQKMTIEALCAEGHDMKYAEVEMLLKSYGDHEAVDSSQIAVFEREVASCERYFLRSDPQEFVSLHQISQRIGLSWFEQRCLLLAIAAEWDRKYEKVFTYLQADYAGKMPTCDLALQLFSTDSERVEHERLLRPDGKLFTLFLKNDSELAIDERLFSLARPLKLCDDLLRLIGGQGVFSGGHPTEMACFLPEVPLDPIVVQTDLQFKLLRMIEIHRAKRNSTQAEFLLMIGPKGCGKTFHLKHVAKRLQVPLVSVDLGRMMVKSQNMQTWVQQIQRVLTVAKIQQAIVAFDHFDQLQDQKEIRYLLEFVNVVERFQYPIVLNSTKTWKSSAISLQSRVVQLDFEGLNEQERRTLWQNGLVRVVSNGAVRIHLDHGNSGHSISEQAIPEQVARSIATHFELTPGQIRAALEQATIQTAIDQTDLTMQQLFRACYLQTEHQLTQKAKKLSPKYHWADLILPKDQMEQLRGTCNHVKFKHIVYGEWGYDSKLSYGKGISMLFAGPPGTGKTMSAEIIANDLQLEIYKIDLSQVVSKYIGETEKNLNELFNEAQKSHAILFFDEMDALFGKRTEVKDSHDKYANLETAYLLQKMEEYKGISILASNHINNIDEAFMRRINYIIRFPFPDAEQRELIWRSSFPKECPLADDIDFPFLAKRFEMAGGNIKNVVMTAAFLAVENEPHIRMKHILQAVKYEQQKTGKTVLQEDLGPYRNLLN